MNQRQFRLIRGAETALGFVNSLKDPPPRITEAAKRLDSTVHDLKSAELKQLGAKNLLGAPHISVNRAKQILFRKHLDPIVADGLEMFAGLPGIEDSLRLPRVKDGPAEYLAAAERVRRVAAEHEQEFTTDRDYDPDFLERFDLAVQNLEAAVRVTPGFARARYSRATQDVTHEIERVGKAFDSLDTRIREAYLDDRDTLKLWRKQSRIPAKLGRPKKRKPPKE